MPRRKKGNQQEKEQSSGRHGFGISKVQPLTTTQSDVFDAFDNSKNLGLMLHGVAGTGKTFLSLYLALKDIIDGVDNKKKVFIVRSVVPTRDMGFLPGNQKEKARAYESPYYSICNELFGRGDAYETLKAKGVIEFITTSFVRGITLDNCIVVVDECQNMAGMELHSVMTRIGNNCRIIFCGDTRQDDLTSERKKEESGLAQFMPILKKMNSFSFIEFGEQDIVRSDLVKEYIITRNRLGLDWC
jgi:phosphate starvation-inducible PhoH-like protein